MAEEFGGKWRVLLDRIDEDFPQTNHARGNLQSVWRKFCLAVLTGAKWLTQFKDANAFYRWVERHDRNAPGRGTNWLAPSLRTFTGTGRHWLATS
ncbi:MAG: hypothetical protein U0792_16870 [Gemmataceae bacterium]